MPAPDQFSSRKKARSDKSFQKEMQGIFSCVQDLTDVIKTSVSSKMPQSDDSYKSKINDFFKNLNEDQRDALMADLLEIIVTEN